MHEIHLEQIFSALQEVGVRQGDGLLVHSALQYLGRPKGGVQIYLQAFFEILDIEGKNNSSTGTLATPTFNFDFARGEAYDPLTTPSHGMGVFSDMVRQHPLARRTLHPMQSLAVIGRYAEDLASRDTPSAFDPGSAYDRMVELDFKLLLLGADIQAVSLLHYCEQNHAVPYRLWKDFEGEVNTPNGWKTKKYCMYVRDMDIDAQLTLRPVQTYLEERGQWVSIPVNYGYISLCKLQDLVAAVNVFLLNDPWSLVLNRPSGC